MKRAYTDLAMRFHPDRHAESAPEARARAEFQMREVNAAWEVLRNPARRADYDARLRGDTPVWEAGGARAKRTAPVAPHVANLQAQQPPGTVVSPPTSWRAGPIIAVGVVLVIVALGFAAWATTSSSDGDGEVDVEVGTPISEGSCVVLASVDGRVTAVANQCSAIGALRVVQVVDLGRPCPAATEWFDVQADEVRLCLSADGS